jgi:hypothetical protein
VFKVAILVFKVPILVFKVPILALIVKYFQLCTKINKRPEILTILRTGTADQHE